MPRRLLPSSDDGFDRAPVDGSFIGRQQNAKYNLILNNLRALVILTVVGFHSMLAYLGSLNASAFAFDDPPYEWRAFPIVDNHRWIGFDVFCAWQDVYLMALMFFLSALFTWPSLARKGRKRFVADRLLRLGMPFVFALAVIMPLALYPIYRVTAADPGLIAYGRHYLALPFWPNGPMWFLWQLFALTLLAAGLHRWAPGWIERLGRWSAIAATNPGRYFFGLATASVLSYVPMALTFTPWTWSDHGPFALQFSRPLLYAVFYVAGLGIGVYGLERGLLAPNGKLVRQWTTWLAIALASFVLWMGLTALAMAEATAAPTSLLIAVDFSFALACAGSCIFVMAGCLRFGTKRSRILDNLASNSFGIYLVHYVFIVWIQYALLEVPLFAVAKALTVFAGTISFACGTTIAMRFMPFGWRLVGRGTMRIHEGAIPGGNQKSRAPNIRRYSL